MCFNLGSWIMLFFILHDNVLSFVVKKFLRFPITLKTGCWKCLWLCISVYFVVLFCYSWTFSYLFWCIDFKFVIWYILIKNFTNQTYLLASQCATRVAIHIWTVLQGHLHTYRFCDNVWTFILQDALFKKEDSQETVGRVKIVACDSKLLLQWNHFWRWWKGTVDWDWTYDTKPSTFIGWIFRCT